MSIDSKIYSIKSNIMSISIAVPIPFKVCRLIGFANPLIYAPAATSGAFHVLFFMCHKGIHVTI